MTRNSNHLALFAALGALLDDLLPLRINLLVVDVARSLDLLALRWLRTVKSVTVGWKSVIVVSTDKQKGLELTG